MKRKKIRVRVITLELPSDKKSAKFSKTNWGDHILVTLHGERVVKHASVFLNKISTLKDQQWDNILERALAFQSSFRKQHATVLRHGRDVHPTWAKSIT